MNKHSQVWARRKIFDGDIQTLFFDFKDGRIIRAKDVLRLRKEEEKAELTYKKVRFTQAAKTAEEYSVDVSNLETTKTILENLGLSVRESMEKHRVSYTLDHVRFDIDRYFGSYELHSRVHGDRSGKPRFNPQVRRAFGF